MTNQEFYNLCREHDWNYMFSGSKESFAAGDTSNERLKAIMHGNQQLKRIYSEFMAFVRFGGPAPMCPEEDNV